MVLARWNKNTSFPNRLADGRHSITRAMSTVVAGLVNGEKGGGEERMRGVPARKDPNPNPKKTHPMRLHP